MSNDPLSEFARRLEEAGLHLAGPLQTDGKLQRCGTTERPKGTDGAYKIHLDPPASLWFKNWKTGQEGTATVKPDNELTPAEREALRRRMEADRAAALAEAKRRHTEAAKTAARIWEAAQPASADNPYLKRKQVQVYGELRQTSDGRLVVPVRNETGGLMSLQFISADGSKRFLKGGQTAGGFFPLPARNGSKDGPLVIAEGYATAASIHAATGYAVLVAFSAGNLKNMAQMAWGKYPKRAITIAADYDRPNKQHPQPGGTGLALATEAARAIGAALAVPRLEGHDKLDFHDLACLMGLDEVANQVVGAPRADGTPENKMLRAVSVSDLLKMDIPPRGYVLYPVIPEQGLAMLHAMRGVGKTYSALSMALAVASGGGVFGRWKADKPRRVLYLDGEMPLSAMQQRLAGILRANIETLPEGDNSLDDNFKLVNPDMQPDFIMPNLATAEGQKMVEPYVKFADFIVIDNLATLARTGKANSEDDWYPVQEWLLSLRRRGKSALLVHHEGKNGSQRGTTGKEDVLDTVIRLSRPSDYESTEGARFIVSLTKARGIIGADAESFEARLNPGGTWSTKAADDILRVQLTEFVSAGMTTREIGVELKMDASTVSRKCRAFGIKLPSPGGNRRAF